MSKKMIFAVIFLLFSAWTLQAASISGLVTDGDTEAPIAGATVRLISGGGSSGQPLDTVATAATDAAGAFSFADVAVGRHEISVSMAGYRENSVNARVRIETDEINREIALDPEGVPIGEGSISGTVTSAGDGAAVPGATVVLLERGYPADTTTTDAAGQYTFTGLGESRYGIEVTAEGFDSDRMGGIELTEGAAEIADMALEAYVPPNGVISGTISLSSTGDPVGAGVSVVLIQTTGGGWIEDPVYELVEATATDQSGMYQFTGLESSGGGGGFFLRYAVVLGTDTTTFIQVRQDDTTAVDIEVAPDDAIDILFVSGKSGISFVRSDNLLIFRGLKEAAQIQVYNFIGRLLQSGKVDDENNSFRLQTNLINEPLILKMKSNNFSRGDIIR